MKKFALIGGGRVSNILAAEDAASLGGLAQSFITVDITDLSPAPSVGWGWSRTEGFFAPVADNQKHLLTGDVLVLETSAPVVKSSAKKKDKATDDTASEE